MDTVFPSKNSVKAIKHHPSNQQLKESFQTIVPFFFNPFQPGTIKKPQTNPSYFKSTGKNVMHPV